MIIYKKTDKSHIKIKGAIYRKPPKKFLRSIFKKLNAIHKIPVLSKARAREYMRNKRIPKPKKVYEVKSIHYSGEIISIHTARINKLVRYFTGEACVKGHVAQRRTSGSACCVCFNENQRKGSESRRRKAGVKPMEVKINEARALAIKNGETKYWDGKPCPHGHIGWRKTKSYNCLECDRLRRAGEKRKKKPWSEMTDEQKEKLRESHRKYMKNNPEKRSALEHKKRAKRKGADGNHTGTEVKKLLIKQNYKCTYCGSCIKNGYHKDHVMPISKGGSNYISNIALACKSCNLLKGALLPEDWAKKNGRLI